MQEILVLGHRNPDTDSLASSIAYAHLKNVLWVREAKARGEEEPEAVAVAAALGPPNPESEFVLQHFGVPAPRLVSGLRLRVADVMSSPKHAVDPDTPLRAIGDLIRETDLKSLPVTNAQGRLLGIVTTGDIARKYLEERQLVSWRDNPITVANLVRTLHGQLAVGNLERDGQRQLTGKVVIAAMDASTLKRYVGAGDIVIIGDRPRAQSAAIQLGVAALIVTSDLPVSQTVIDAAVEAQALIIRVPSDAYTTARLLSMSLPVSSTMTSDVITLHPDALLEDARKVMVKTKHRRYPVVDGGRLVGMISRGSLLEARGKRVILVDHNERSQAAEGINEAEILEVVDHHRLGDVQTIAPILFRNEPVGSTATVVAGIYEEAGVEPPPVIAGLLLSAILSDTLLFQSPTTTRKDDRLANWLAALAGVNIETFGRELLKAGTSLRGLSPKDILREDFKEFQFGEYKIGVAQVETMDMGEVESLTPGLFAEMQRLVDEKAYSLVMLMVTDLWRGGSALYPVGPAAGLVEEAFGLPLQHRMVYLPGVMSRKKQVIPPLARAIEVRGL